MLRALDCRKIETSSLQKYPLQRQQQPYNRREVVTNIVTDAVTKVVTWLLKVLCTCSERISTYAFAQIMKHHMFMQIITVHIMH